MAAEVTTADRGTTKGESERGGGRGKKKGEANEMEPVASRKLKQKA